MMRQKSARDHQNEVKVRFERSVKSKMDYWGVYLHGHGSIGRDSTHVGVGSNAVLILSFPIRYVSLFCITVCCKRLGIVSC